MRFLFVYQDHAVAARSLVQELLVSDVRVIVVRKHELHPNDAELGLLKEHVGSEAAACQVNRKYRKNVDAFVKFTLVPKKFRIDDQQLREWLSPPSESTESVISPAAAFERLAQRVPEMRLHREALVRADELDETRWPFANRAADLLARVASGENIGPFREWEERYGVAFAANGQVRYRYRIDVAGESRVDATEWHLKAGDRTTPERAARIYFVRVDAGGKPYVLVFYVGPHPSNGEYNVTF